MSNEYRISTIADFLAVPEDKIDACLADFKQWISIAREPSTLETAIDDLAGAPGSTKFMTVGFTWVDDGIPGLSAVDIVGVENPDELLRLHFHPGNDAEPCSS